ncbi:MAG: LamG-like jellyroll fold domain-containing protein [Planctomycetota bacterium]
MFIDTKTLFLAALASIGIGVGHAEADLIAHYTFDTDNAGTTPDEVGPNVATLGSQVQINTTVAGRIGGGALEMLGEPGSGNVGGPSSGAVTSNSFDWTNDARTLSFWWKIDPQASQANNGTYVSFGDNSENGSRFDVKRLSSSALRVEVQGAGANSSPAIDDGEWHFIAVVVPNDAFFNDILWFVDGGADISVDQNVVELVTGSGPLAFGDSISTDTTFPRVPNGFLDDVQLYDEALTTEQIAFLYANPGSVIPEPGSLALLGVGGLFVLRRRRS